MIDRAEFARALAELLQRVGVECSGVWATLDKDTHEPYASGFYVETVEGKWRVTVEDEPR